MEIMEMAHQTEMVLQVEIKLAILDQTQLIPIHHLDQTLQEQIQHLGLIQLELTQQDQEVAPQTTSLVKATTHAAAAIRITPQIIPGLDLTPLRIPLLTLRLTQLDQITLPPHQPTQLTLQEVEVEVSQIIQILLEEFHSLHVISAVLSQVSTIQGIFLTVL